MRRAAITSLLALMLTGCAARRPVCCANVGLPDPPKLGSHIEVELLDPLTPPTAPVNHFCERQYVGDYPVIKCSKVLDCDDYPGMPMWDNQDLNFCPKRI